MDAVRPEMERIVDQHNGVLVYYDFYPNNYIFSRKPVNSLEDFAGLKTRVHSTVLGDLVTGIGAEGQFMALSEVYTALERGA